jgi:hypothetical protein
VRYRDVIFFNVPIKEAVALTFALAALVYDGVAVQQAIDIFNKHA